MISKKQLSKIDQLSQNLQSEVKSRNLWQRAYLRFIKNKAAMISFCLLVLIILMVLFASNLSPYPFDDTDWYSIHKAPSFGDNHYFGTDSLGRDLFIRTLYGGRVSLAVGILGAIVAVLIGTIYGASSGYIGGNVDRVMMRIVEIMNSIPFMFFVILLVTFFGRQLFLIFVAIGAVSWLDIARIVRGQTLSLRHKEFIEAAQTYGVSQTRIIIKHIIPNVIGVVIVYSTLLVPSMILFESFLSFLGLGVQEPMTSWGSLLREGSQTMELAIWQLIFPAIFMTTTLFCFNYIGDGLRDALDPKES